jgi:hypothetical protein
VSILSVLISSSGSRLVTASPGCLSQRATVPSTTLSPSWGILTTVAIGSIPSTLLNAKTGARGELRGATPAGHYSQLTLSVMVPCHAKAQSRKGILVLASWRLGVRILIAD